MHLYHGRANAIHPYNNLLTQTEDVLCNPINPVNPVNPDSKLIFTGIVTLKTYQKIEDACIASARCMHPNTI
jgi:hypothetical protein